MSHKEKRVIYLALCISRVIFLFGDYFLSSQTQPQVSNIQLERTQNIQAPNESTMQDKVRGDIQNIGILQQQTENIHLEDLQKNNASNFDDIQALQNIYSKTQSKMVLNILLEKLVQTYQFAQAKKYLLTFNSGAYSKDIPPHLYLYILINSISITNPNDINDFENIMQSMYDNNILEQDEYAFYLGLLQIRNKNRNGASKYFKSVSNPRYAKLIKNYTETLNNPYLQKDSPAYYKDGLIALTMLKNGYFSIAKKIALSVAMGNDKYILPYQILAYSHFLTNDRDSSIDYLFKLIDINPNKEENYKFLIGISYYRASKYEQSVLYLSQIKGQIYQTDVYRYLILNYIAGNDYSKLIRMWQSILGQNNLEKSDFYTFFYNVFYVPFQRQEIFSVYNNNPQLTTSFLDKCYETFATGDDDICIYGQAGQDIASSNWQGAKDKLLYLGDRYPQGYIFHSLGDYYYNIKDFQQAKQYYIKAVSMTVNEAEKSIIRKKLIEQP